MSGEAKERRDKYVIALWTVFVFFAGAATDEFKAHFVREDALYGHMSKSAVALTLAAQLRSPPQHCPPTSQIAQPGCKDVDDVKNWVDGRDAALVNDGVKRAVTNFYVAYTNTTGKGNQIDDKDVQAVVDTNNRLQTCLKGLSAEGVFTYLHQRIFGAPCE
jgi:hypothetical protein